MVSNAGRDDVPARRAAAAADTHQPTNLAGREEQHPQECGIEDRVDREAGPDWHVWQQINLPSIEIQ
jgi:hypothetical protein